MPEVDHTCTPCSFDEPCFTTKHQVRIRFTQSGANAGRPAMVTPKEVCTSGICVFYRGYIHPGTSCEVELITLYGSWLQVDGKVIRCRYVEEGMHQIGIKFESEIDVTLICPDATEQKVVVATHDDFLWELASAWLSHGNAHPSRVATMDEFNTTLESKVDLLIIDDSFGDPNGVTVAQKARRYGYFGYLVGLHREGNDDLASEFISAGADQVTVKPLSRKEAERLLESSRVEPTVSTWATEPGAHVILKRCISMLNTMVLEAGEAFRSGKMEAVVSVIERIRSTAGAGGFEEIEFIADEVAERCSEQAIEQVGAEFAKVARLISAASV